MKKMFEFKEKKRITYDCSHAYVYLAYLALYGIR